MKRLPLIWIISLFSLFFVAVSKSQSIITNPIEDTIKRADYLKPLFEIFGINMLMNRFDYHILGKEWANVTPSSWWINLDRGFYTDGDAFPTNWIGHPFHGSLAFNAARTHNVGFWASVP